MMVKMMKTSKDFIGQKYGFKSGLEEKVADQLKALGIRYSYESLSLPFIQPEKKRRYTTDFHLHAHNIIIETKGRFMLADRQKHLWIKEQYPHLDIRFVFTNPNNRIAKGSKTTYADWCNKNNFKYAKKFIPEEWLKELK